jgi:hypothetical protein
MDVTYQWVHKILDEERTVREGDPEEQDARCGSA